MVCLESITYLISDIDFKGVFLKQRMRTFLVFEDNLINQEILKILNNNNITTFFNNKNNLKMDTLLQMVNSNNFNFVNKEG